MTIVGELAQEAVQDLTVLEQLGRFIQEHEILRIVGLVFIITLSVVYIPGRLLSLTSSSRVKSMLALISITTFSPLFYLNVIPMKIQHLLLVTGIGIIFYTLVGMRLFDRIDYLLSKKVGPSSYKEPKPKKPRKSKKD